MAIYKEHMGDYCSNQELYFPYETSKDVLHFGNGKCIEVRLSLLELHFYQKVIMNAATQLNSHDLTQALLSSSHF